ncbi:hypothetical protein ACFZB9_31345 [Kitasatospora sp. NPDC008050]|uniref:hypothetical protein n=1 Tax=Kitasatospora sp. NPDC008050 TaxID=3364021 RepID=UPI0036F06D06
MSVQTVGAPASPSRSGPHGRRGAATGMNNTSAAAALAGSQFGGHPAVMLPIFFYGMTQQLPAAAVPAVLGRRASGR